MLMVKIIVVINTQGTVRLAMLRRARCKWRQLVHARAVRPAELQPKGRGDVLN
jgi:hypothetical protein